MRFAAQRETGVTSVEDKYLPYVAIGAVVLIIIVMYFLLFVAGR